MNKISGRLLFILASAFWINIACSADILSNSINKNPPLSENLSIFFVDLSGSVDHEVVIRGFKNIKNELAFVYNQSDDVEDNIPAKTYYRWMPVMGAEQNPNPPGFSIFTEEHDVALWSAAKQVKGKSNQIQVLNKLRASNGLWSFLMSAEKLDFSTCEKTAISYLQSPGISNRPFQRLIYSVCNTALEVRNNLEVVEVNVDAYTNPNSANKRSTSGTDIFGAINKLESVAQNSEYLDKFKEINLVFVSDMIHFTDLTNLKTSLVGNDVNGSCKLASKYAGTQSGFDGKYKVTIYGLGEVKEKPGKSTAENESLYPLLKQFWNCFWVEKGQKIPTSDFKSLTSFGK